MPYQDLAPDAGPEDIQQKGADAPSEDLPVEGQYWLDEYETITYLTYDEFVADIVSVAKPITENTMPTLVRVVNGEPFYTMKNRFFIAYASINGNVIRTLYDYNAEIVENSDRTKIFQPPGSVKCGEYKGLPIFEANPDVSNEPPEESSSVTSNASGTTTKTTQNTKTGETTTTTKTTSETEDQEPDAGPATPNTETTTPSTVTEPPPTASSGTVYNYEVLKPGFDRYDFKSGKKVFTTP
jgi:hypothetical protein